MHNYPGGDALSTLHQHFYYSIDIPSLTPSSCSSMQYIPHHAHQYSFQPLKPPAFIPQSYLEATVCVNPNQFHHSQSYQFKKCHHRIHIDAASAIAGITRYISHPLSLLCPN